MVGFISNTGGSSDNTNDDLVENKSISIGRMVNFTDQVTRNFSAQPLNTGKLTQSPSIISSDLSKKTSSTYSSLSSTSPPANSSDTFTIPVTITIISITLYVSYYLWRKHRHRTLSALSKLEEYRYSRLSQTEVDVDNDRFNDVLSPQNECIASNELECDDHGLKPATLQLETDSLITIHDEMSNLQMSKGGSNTSNGLSSTTSGIIEDLSDEDLLQ